MSKVDTILTIFVLKIQSLKKRKAAEDTGHNMQRLWEINSDLDKEAVLNAERR